MLLEVNWIHHVLRGLLPHVLYSGPSEWGGVPDAGERAVCVGDTPAAKFKMAPEKLPSSLESCLKNHLFFRVKLRKGIKLGSF